MHDPQYGNALEFGDYAAFVKRRWRWILCGLVLGLIIGAAYLQLAPKTYTSTSKVLVYATSSDTELTNGVTSEGINLDTEAQIVRSAAVADGAGDELDDDSSPAQLASNVTVTVPANTTVLEIAFSGSTPAEAQAGASAFADAYLDNRASVAQDAVDADVDRLRDRVDDLTGQLTDVTQQIRETVDASQRTVLRTRRIQLTAQLETLNTQLGPLEGTVQRPGTVIVDPPLPSSPTSPRPFLVMVSTALLGFLGALAAAILREKLDRRPHTTHDLERTYGLPVMSEVRVFDTVTGIVDAPLPEVRGLYHSIIAAYGGSTRSVLVCGPSDQSSADAIGATLAVLAAQTGTTTVHVREASRRDAAVRSEARDIDRRGALTRRDYATLGLVNAGELRHRRIRPVLDQLESDFDMAVLELPTGDPSFDLPLLGRYVDLVLIVVELDNTSRVEMEEVVDDVKKVGATDVVGVAVRRDRKRARKRGRNRPHVPLGTEPDPSESPVDEVDLDDVSASEPRADAPTATEPRAPHTKGKSKLLHRGA
ncbi:Wzz/FepE/Etk N-terminal domain-containing protein [Solicola gregarius]|uniref:Wzz/FepE/Etk N-terminal domain-containing protein n=1 Tax=Solicola gregarius TaxID=2908642 RepID=A0AA46TKG6_9ACTN|nr:Wzz/FepE/Etk N-terminal domain-containing protein [Solicola gregarius]UYM06559.1 Wzz/FepE/Etk N-terminal domain-containing protein [Solicola gregarius]